MYVTSINFASYQFGITGKFLSNLTLACNGPIASVYAQMRGTLPSIPVLLNVRASGDLHHMMV